MKLITVVVTKTRGLCNQLARDLQERYYCNLPKEERPLVECFNVYKDTDVKRKDRIKKCIAHYGVVVVNMHVSPLTELAWLICERRGYGLACDYVLVEDESDRLNAKTEQSSSCALKVLEGTKYSRDGSVFKMDLGSPPLIVHITATPLPILLNERIIIQARD